MPLITFIDTSGAYPGVGAEERGQSEAIARNLFEMATLRSADRQHRDRRGRLGRRAGHRRRRPLADAPVQHLLGDFAGRLRRHSLAQRRQEGPGGRGHGRQRRAHRQARRRRRSDQGAARRRAPRSAGDGGYGQGCAAAAPRRAAGPAAGAGRDQRGEQRLRGYGVYTAKGAVVAASSALLRTASTQLDRLAPAAPAPSSASLSAAGSIPPCCCMRWLAPSPIARTTACAPLTSIIGCMPDSASWREQCGRSARSRCRSSSSRWSSRVAAHRRDAASRRRRAKRATQRSAQILEPDEVSAHRSSRRRSAGDDAAGADARRRAARPERRAVRPDLRRRLARATAAGVRARRAGGVGARRAAAVAGGSFQRQHELRPQFSAPSRAAGAARALAGRGAQRDSLDRTSARGRAGCSTCSRPPISKPSRSVPASSMTRLASLAPARRRNVLRHWIRQQGMRVPSTRKLATIEHDLLIAREDRLPCVEWDGVQMRRHRGLLYCMRQRPPFEPADALTWNVSQVLELPAQLGRAARAARCARRIGGGATAGSAAGPLPARRRGAAAGRRCASPQAEEAAAGRARAAVVARSRAADLRRAIGWSPSAICGSPRSSRRAAARTRCASCGRRDHAASIAIASPALTSRADLYPTSRATSSDRLSARRDDSDDAAALHGHRLQLSQRRCSR